MQFGRDKYTKVIFWNVSQVKFKNIILDINMEITELEYRKTYKYLGNNEVNDIKHTMNKEKIK